MRKNDSYYEKNPNDSKKWILLDASDNVLGRLATQVVKILRGKNKPTYTPSVNMGDYVIVINAQKVRVTGKKETDKFYYRHSGYPGGLKSINFRDQIAKDASKVIMSAVKGMLPKGRLGRKLLTKVKVYNDEHHPHEAQLAASIEN